MRGVISLLLVASSLCAAPSSPEAQKAKRLSNYIKKEKKRYQAREAQKRSLLSELDRLNSKQNQTRQKMSEIELQKMELVMAEENLALEISKQREVLAFERARMSALLKILYRLRRDGLLSFVLRGESLSSSVRQGRILYRAIRSHSSLTQKIEARGERLVESEARLGELQQEVELLLSDLSGQQDILTGMLRKKRRLKRMIEKRQGPYLAAVREHKALTKRLKKMFRKMEKGRKKTAQRTPSRKGTLVAPVLFGKIIKKFGKTVHKKFKTVTLQKGLEISAPHQTPVRAIAQGKVEFSGWIPGLGNVLIVHHDGGLYSLNGYLFRSEFKAGDEVQAGETIAYVGDTGKSSKPSLYFELRERTKAVNPLGYFDAETRQALLEGRTEKAQG